MKDIKLIAFDLDGTLLTPEKTVTERTLSALRRADAAGMVLAAVTGRPVSGIPPVLLRSGLLRYAITSNGSVICDLKRRKKTAAFLLSQDKVREILSVLRDIPTIYDVVVDGYGYSDAASHEKLLRKYRGTAAFAYISATRRGLESRDAVLERAAEGTENVWIMPDDAAMREQILPGILQIPGLYVMHTGRMDIEMTEEHAGKGKALRVLCSSLGIAPETCMALGDDGNDLDLFACAGVTAAMGNALEEVKRAASFVTDDNLHDGAAKAIERFLPEASS